MMFKKRMTMHPSGSSMTDDPLGALGVNFDCRTTLFMEKVVAFQALAEMYNARMSHDGSRYPEAGDLLFWKKLVLCVRCEELRNLAKQVTPTFEIAPRFKKNGEIVRAEERFLAAIREYHELLRSDPEDERLYRRMVYLAREKADALQRLLLALVEKEKESQEGLTIFQYASYVKAQFLTNEFRKGKGKGIRAYRSSAKIEEKIAELETDLRGLLKRVYQKGCPPMRNVAGISWKDIVEEAGSIGTKECRLAEMAVGAE